MGRKKLKVQTTDVSNLVGSLRGEVGEVITAWTFLRDFKYQAQQVQTGDPKKDIHNADLSRLNFLCSKFEDEIVSRLSELSERKIGQITFYFASVKLNALSDDVKEYESFIINEKFRDRRNNYVSHKYLPLKWEDHRLPPYIHYTIILRAISKAICLMKRFDDLNLGPKSKYLWFEMRKRRYTIMYPPHAAYILLPYYRLSNDVRFKLLKEEAEIGKSLWVDMPTKINGKDAIVRACKEWGIIQLGDRLIALDTYPLIELKNIEAQ